MVSVNSMTQYKLTVWRFWARMSGIGSDASQLTIRLSNISRAHTIRIYDYHDT